jgi:hypothetical protein
MTSVQRSAIEDRRRRLEKKILAFHESTETYMGMVVSDDDGADLPVLVDEWDELESDEEATDEGELSHDETIEVPKTTRGPRGEDMVADHDGEMICVEKLQLCLPSRLGRAKIHGLQLEILASQERQLREGQANDALAALRLELGYKAHLFRSNVQNSQNVKGKTRIRLGSHQWRSENMFGHTDVPGRRCSLWEQMHKHWRNTRRSSRVI